MENIGFLAHGFVIIDLVPEEDMQTARHIEENLLDAINAENSGLFCERHRCETKDELIAVLNQVKKRLRDTGEVSYIHIEGHGSKENIQLLDGSVLPWGTVSGQSRYVVAGVSVPKMRFNR